MHQILNILLFIGFIIIKRPTQPFPGTTQASVYQESVRISDSQIVSYSDLWIIDQDQEIRFS